MNTTIPETKPQSLVNLVSLCARVARAVEDGRLNTSPEGLARTPPPQQSRLLREPSSPLTRCCHQPRAALPQLMPHVNFKHHATHSCVNLVFYDSTQSLQTHMPRICLHAPAAAAAARPSRTRTQKGTNAEKQLRVSRESILTNTLV